MGKKKHGTSGTSSGDVNHPGGNNNSKMRNKKKKNAKKLYEKETTTNDNTFTASTIETKSYYTKIIKQLQQQSDISIRHSTLAALLHTTFNISTNNNTSTTTATNTGNNNAAAVLKKQQQQQQNIPRTLLQVIRDQITSLSIPISPAVVTKNSKQQMKQIKEQLHCSLLATECLSNYIVLTHDNSNNNNSNDIDTEWISGWILIFLQRIHEYILYNQHEQQQQHIGTANDTTNVATGSNINSSSNTTNTTTTSTTSTTIVTTTIQVLYIQFIEQCIIGIINLLEYIPSSMQRLYTYQQRCLSNTNHKNNKNNNNINTMMDLHEMIYHLLLQIPQQEQVHQVKEAYESLQYNIIQCLHIVWDDSNIDMILPLLEYNTNLYYEIQQILYTIIIKTTTNEQQQQQSEQQLNDSNDNNDSSIQQLVHTNTSKLHCIGAIMSVYNSILVEDATVSTSLETLHNNVIDRDILSTCVKFVQSTILIPSSKEMNHMNNNTLLYYIQNIVLQRVINIYEIYYNEINDTQLEKQILHQQLYKQESARSIARRLMNHNKNHHKNNNKDQLINPDDVSKVDDNDVIIMSTDEITTTTSNTNTNTKTTTKLNKKVSSWEEVQVEWYTTIRPIQLSLELLMNWTSSSSSSVSSQIQNDITDSNHMDVDDNDNDQNQSNVLIDELRKCDIYYTVYELYTFLLHWYQQILNTSNMEQKSLSVPNIMIQNTILDLLSKTIVIIGHCYMNHIIIVTPSTQSSSTTPTTSSSDSWIQLWNDLKSLLVMCRRFSDCSSNDTSTIDTRESTITSNCTKSSVDNGQVDQMVTVDGDSINNTVITNDNVMEDITTVSEIGNDGMVIATTDETLNHTTGISNHENYESIVRLQESITGTMVTLLRSKINEMFNNNNNTKLSFVQDLLNLLHQGTTIQTDVSTIYHQPIVLRDIVCMIGIILSTYNDCVIEMNTSPIYQTVTEKLLHTSSLFINQLQQQQQQCNSTNSIQHCRHITLVVVFEILNILMDMYSTDDTIDSLKYNLFYNNSHTNNNESVLQHIQRMIPIMKQQLVHYKNNNNNHITNNITGTNNEMIVEEWNEIVHNLIRFVQYKKETKNM